MKRTISFMLILFIVLAAFGVFVQITTTRRIEIESYNRMSETVA